MDNTTNEIKEELYKALTNLKAPSDLLATVGSWGDTLEDGEVLGMLKAWNAGGIWEEKYAERKEHFTRKEVEDIVEEVCCANLDLRKGPSGAVDQWIKNQKK